jgi:hypothetical protein
MFDTLYDHRSRVSFRQHADLAEAPFLGSTSQHLSATLLSLPETVRSGSCSVNPKPPAHGALVGSNQLMRPHPGQICIRMPRLPPFVWTLHTISLLV